MLFTRMYIPSQDVARILHVYRVRNTQLPPLEDPHDRLSPSMRNSAVSGIASSYEQTGTEGIVCSRNAVLISV